MQKKDFYPIKFHPILKKKIWGGDKLHLLLGKSKGIWGESWEISGLSGNVSVVKNGWLEGKSLTTLLEDYSEEILGVTHAKKFGCEFPLLIKFIDANQDLSVQVHPNDEQAKIQGEKNGKTEMWYVMHAEEDGSLIAGFNQKVTEEAFKTSLANHTLDTLLNRCNVHAEDVYYLPAGRLHTIGKGLLIAEIQQSSDTTYRIYDYDRVDDKGQKRALHIQQAVEVIDFEATKNPKTPFAKNKNQVNEVIKVPFFTTNYLEIDHRFERQNTQHVFHIYLCVEGSGEVIWGEHQSLALQKGETILIPATLSSYAFETSSRLTLLETYIQPTCDE